MNDLELRRLTENVERLAGELPKNQEEAAVLIKDLAAIFRLNEKLQSAAAAGSTPTKAEFDALVDDVAMIHRRLYAMMLALQARVI